MPIFTVQASGSTAVAKNHPNTNYSNLAQYKLFAEPFTGTRGDVNNGDNIYIKFPTPGDAYKFKRVTNVTLTIYAQPTEESETGYKQIWAYVNGLASPLNVSTVTYATRPSAYKKSLSQHADGNWSTLNEIIQLSADLKPYSEERKAELKSGIKNGFVFAFRGAVWNKRSCFLRRKVNTQAIPDV